MFVSKQQYAVLFFLSFCTRNKVFSPFSLTLDRHCQFDATCLYIVLDLFFARCRTQVITVSALLNSPLWNQHFPRTINALPSSSSNYIYKRSFTTRQNWCFLFEYFVSEAGTDDVVCLYIVSSCTNRDSFSPSTNLFVGIFCDAWFMNAAKEAIWKTSLKCKHIFNLNESQKVSIRSFHIKISNLRK